MTLLANIDQLLLKALPSHYPSQVVCLITVQGDLELMCCLCPS